MLVYQRVAYRSHNVRHSLLGSTLGFGARSASFSTAQAVCATSLWPGWRCSPVYIHQESKKGASFLVSRGLFSIKMLTSWDSKAHFGHILGDRSRLKGGTFDCTKKANLWGCKFDSWGIAIITLADCWTDSSLWGDIETGLIRCSKNAEDLTLSTDFPSSSVSSRILRGLRWAQYGHPTQHHPCAEPCHCLLVWIWLKVNPSRTSFCPKMLGACKGKSRDFLCFFQQLDTSILQTYCKHSSFTDSGTVKSAWIHIVLFPQETFFHFFLQ